MERLTNREPRVSGLPGVCCTHFEGRDCQAIQGHCADGCLWEEAAWSRLAAYEDTGLKPEAVKAMKTAMMGKSIAEIKEFDGISIEHLRELAQAEQDGRLVVPCKGSTSSLGLLLAEYERQDKLWGDQSGNHPFEWMSIIGEEYGELCEAVNETCFENPRHPERGGYEAIIREATHVAAVALHIMDAMLTRKEAEVALSKQKEEQGGGPSRPQSAGRKERVEGMERWLKGKCEEESSC